MSEPRHFAFLDSVRGMAFLLVIMLHAALAIAPFPGKNLASQGGYGVQLFFLASAITLCHSLSQRKQSEEYPVTYFFIRRLFRIAPLFWLALAFYWIFPGVMPAFWLGQWAPSGVHASYFVLTAAFLHGWHPYTFNSIVPGGWSIAVEMTFYAVFPLLFYHVNSLKRAVVAVFLSLVYLKVMLHRGWPCDSVFAQLERHLYAGIPDQVLGFFMGNCFLSQLPVFIVGFLAFYLIREPAMQKAMAGKFWARTLLLACGIGLLHWAGVQGGFVPTSILIVLTFAAGIVALSGAGMRLLVNPFICGLGKISFSCYLVHFAALGLALKWFGHGQVLTEASPSLDAGSPAANLFLYLRLLSAALFLTVLIAALTYRFVEKPGIELGRRLIQRINQRARQSAGADGILAAVNRD
jgi:peptidoglycan/LPS O-acetylase OafA/YrhL